MKSLGNANSKTLRLPPSNPRIGRRVFDRILRSSIRELPLRRTPYPTPTALWQYHLRAKCGEHWQTLQAAPVIRVA